LAFEGDLIGFFPVEYDLGFSVFSQTIGLRIVGTKKVAGMRDCHILSPVTGISLFISRE
jgi:hypothetical protein